MNELDRNYRIVFPSDGKYGARSAQNFGWSGMVGMVLNNVSIILLYQKSTQSTTI